MTTVEFSTELERRAQRFELSAERFEVLGEARRGAVERLRAAVCRTAAHAGDDRESGSAAQRS